MLNEQLQSIGSIVHDMASPILPYRGGTRQPYRVTMSQLAHTPKPLGARQEAALERGAVIDPIILPSLFALFVLSVILEAIKDDSRRHHHRRY